MSLEINNKDSGNSRSCCFSSSFEGKVEGCLCYIISGKCLCDLHTDYPDDSGKGNLDCAVISSVQELHYVFSRRNECNEQSSRDHNGEGLVKIQVHD